MRRFPFAAAVFAAIVSPAAGSAAPTPVAVMLSAPVGEQARTTIPPELWLKIVSGWVNAARTVPGGDEPTVVACRQAGAAYLVSAPFEALSRLPGTPVAADRKTARTHVVVTSCANGTSIFDKTIALESDPLSLANAGDYEPVYEVTWNKRVRSTLAREVIPFPQVARVARIESPYVFLDLPRREGLFVGEVVHVRQTADGALRSPADLQITDLSGKFVQAQLVSPRERVSVGDLVDASSATPAAAR